MKSGIGQQFSLQAARVNRGHTVRSLASELEIDARTLARLEAGEPIHPAKALKVAEYFGVQVTDLMSVEKAAA
jgi:transcriptional regulator with XRE-family HTH domain